ncbi:MAG: DUF992 domain-containing protein [Rhodospirillaceae bacterium]|nr:DUF992 domain-containing protein [Rhodospirillaceae bacterium]
MFLRAITTALLLLLTPALPARAEGGVNVGVLECKVASGFGYILGSSRDMSCTFKRPDGVTESYRGAFDRYGLDIGYTDERWMYWGVFAPGDVAPGALAGKYAGAGADVAAGLGVGANALFGGSNDQISLQPVSVNGNVGVNVAAGVSYVVLTAGK